MRRAVRPATDEEAGAPPSGPPPYAPGFRLGEALEQLARTVALAGGMLLVAVMGMTIASVLGRYLFNAPLPGDYELTELACGVAVFAFFPWCHVRNANIVVDFFTSRMRPRHRAALDAIHGIVFTGVAGLVTWRLFVGGVHKLADGETTLFLAIPIHFGYFPALVGAGLLTAVAAVAVHRHLHALRR